MTGKCYDDMDIESKIHDLSFSVSANISISCRCQPPVCVTFVQSGKKEPLNNRLRFNIA